MSSMALQDSDPTRMLWQLKTSRTICSVILSPGNARMIDMPYGLGNPEAAEKSLFGGAGLAMALRLRTFHALRVSK